MTTHDRPTTAGRALSLASALAWLAVMLAMGGLVVLVAAAVLSALGLGD